MPGVLKIRCGGGRGREAFFYFMRGDGDSVVTCIAASMISSMVTCLAL